jgi:hypothetical protein
MKLTDTLYYFVPVLIGAAGLIASIAFGSVDTPGVSQKPIAASSAQICCYFPAQYTLSGPIQVFEHIQAFWERTGRSQPCPSTHIDRKHKMLRTFAATMSYELTKWCSYALAGLVLVRRAFVFITLIVFALGIFVLGRFVLMPVVWLIRYFVCSLSREKMLSGA